MLIGHFEIRDFEVVPFFAIKNTLFLYKGSYLCIGKKGELVCGFKIAYISKMPSTDIANVAQTFKN
jgi:hypothetical protein